MLAVLVSYTGTKVRENQKSTTLKETTQGVAEAPKVAESTVVNDENIKGKSKLIITGASDKGALSGFAPLGKISYSVE